MTGKWEIMAPERFRNGLEILSYDFKTTFLASPKSVGITIFEKLWYKFENPHFLQTKLLEICVHNKLFTSLHHDEIIS